MNTSAERHIAKAAGYVAKGEEFYRKAAAEIVAARESDPALSLREIDRRNGWSQGYAGTLVRALTNGGPVNWRSGSNKRDDVTAATLREAPLEQVERVIASLPPERQQQVAAAAGHAYHKARVDFDEKERNLTPAQRKERQAAGEAMTRPVVSVTASFEIVSKLEVVLELLRDLNGGGTIPEGMIEPTGQLLEAIQQEYRVLRAMAGLSIDLDEVEA